MPNNKQTDLVEQAEELAPQAEEHPSTTKLKKAAEEIQKPYKPKPSISMVAITELTEHPDNAKIFTSNEREDVDLRAQIELHGVVVPILVNRRSDGALRIVSGHRRVAFAALLGHTEIKAEFISVSDAEELLLLFACNVGRDLKEAYKVRFFKQVKQFLRQNCKHVDKYIGSKDAVEHDNVFVDVVDRMGIDAKKMKIWELIQKITGLSEREQYALTRVCDLDYRIKVMNELRGAKVKESECKHLLFVWQNLEDSIVVGRTTIADVDKQVKALLKQIDALRSPQNDKGKPKKEKPAPFKAEKATEKNASIFTNTTENTYAHIYSMAKRDKKDVPEECKYSFNEVVAMAQRWAELVLENV